MAEYIEREALIAEYDRAHKGPAGGARKLILDAPAADVVEVVRCKDCRNYDAKYGTCLTHSVEPDAYGNGAYIGMNGNDFCSYGERKGNNEIK